MSKFVKVESLPVLESARQVVGVMVVQESDVSDKDPPSPHKVPAETLALDVQVRLGRLLLLVAAVACSILALVVVCWQGVVLNTFPAASKSDSARSKLLDDYNSYSDPVCALRRDLDAARSRAELSRGVCTLVLSAGVGFLLNNALDALNVQLRMLEVRAAIMPNDLSVAGSEEALATNDRPVTTSEATARNPLSNTVLRNLMLPREPKFPLHCPWSTNAQVKYEMVPDDLVEYGIPQRDWQARLLSEAIEPKRLRLIVSATNASANARVRSDDLPMPVARAAILFTNGLTLMSSFLPIEGDASYFTRSFPNVTIPGNEMSPVGLAAVMAGALPPPSVSADDQTQRDWFLNQSHEIWLRHVRLDRSGAIRHSDMALEFSHVQIAPRVVFDAVTFDIEQLRSTSNRTPTAIMDRSQFGPWPVLGQLAKIPFSRDKELYDPPAQVHVFAVCVDDAGEETLLAKASYWDGDSLPPTDVNVQCNATSTSSLLVVSVSKRLLADSLVLQPGGDNATATGLREVYSYTVGRPGWELEDLAELFNATCKTRSGRCRGLHVDLARSNTSTSSASNTNQQLVVVSAETLPLAYVSAPNYRYAYAYGNGKQRSRPPVRVHEPPPPRENNTLYDILADDLLLPHNVRDVQWEQSELWTRCNPVIEDRLQLVVKNHLYMEQSLQPAYTAATFFLLQNAVVKDTIALDATAPRTSLKFDGNQQDIAVRVSVPALNAWLTLAYAIRTNMEAVMGMLLDWLLVESVALLRSASPRATSIV